MIRKQQMMKLRLYMEFYDLVVIEDNLLRRINELIDFSFLYNEPEEKYCLTNGWNVIIVNAPIQKHVIIKNLQRRSLRTV